VQFVFAGKAHPADDEGKEMIRQIVAFAPILGVRHRFVFLDDYDIAVARSLYQGADVWLNTPRRPHEACGTSGMKAALNGTLNCSILDGWWDELFDGENGWAIDVGRGGRGPRDAGPPGGRQPVRPARAPDRAAVPRPPRGWLRRVKANLASLGPAVVASRMVRDYVTELYEPTAAGADLLRGQDHRRARALAAWKARVLAGWDGVKSARSWPTTSPPGSAPSAGAPSPSRWVRSPPSDVSVQLVHGPWPSTTSSRPPRSPP
jgi:starch phosphorylase